MKQIRALLTAFAILIIVGLSVFAVWATTRDVVAIRNQILFQPTGDVYFSMTIKVYAGNSLDSLILVPNSTKTLTRRVNDPEIPEAQRTIALSDIDFNEYDIYQFRIDLQNLNELTQFSVEMSGILQDTLYSTNPRWVTTAMLNGAGVNLNNPEVEFNVAKGETYRMIIEYELNRRNQKITDIEQTISMALSEGN